MDIFWKFGYLAGFTFISLTSMMTNPNNFIKRNNKTSSLDFLKED